MLTPAEADTAIADRVAKAPEEDLPLAACAGRVLRQDVHAERDAPPFDRVAMDGIALALARARDQRTFRIAGLQAAGQPAMSLADPGECLEVMTGATLPAGCDTVVPVERIAVAEGRATLETGYTPALG